MMHQSIRQERNVIRQPAHVPAPSRPLAPFVPAASAGHRLANIAVAPRDETVQRKVQLTDSDAGIYEELEKEKPASEAGELYFTDQYFTDKKVDESDEVDDDKVPPIFVNATVVDDMRNDIDKAVERLGNKARSQIEAEMIFAAVKQAKFYTDGADVTGQLGDGQKRFCLGRALSAPMLSNPNRARGLAHRFAEPNGVMFSKYDQSNTEELLKMKLPTTVTFYHVLATDWYAVVEQHKTFWTEVTENIAYGRHENLRDIIPRDQRSKFRQGTGKDASFATDDKLKDDTLKDKLPAAQPDYDSDWIEYKAHARKKTREAGQYKAMNDWNALAYAGYMHHHGHDGAVKLGQDWEWLHVQGAQNGGRTDAKNLVAGTTMTNTRMIPWEDEINRWSNLADRDYPLAVRFEGKRVDKTNLGSEIKISIAAEKGLPGVTDRSLAKDSPMTLIFKPLDGTVFDKVSQHLTRSLTADIAKKESGTPVHRTLFINKGIFKGYWADLREMRGDRAVVLVQAVGRVIELPKADLTWKTTEISK